MSMYQWALERQVFVSDEHLILLDYDSREAIEWGRIKHLFVDYTNMYLSVVDDMGKSSYGRIEKDDHFSSVSEKIQTIWSLWKYNIPNPDKIERFEFYPWIEKAESSIVFLGILFFGGVAISTIFKNGFQLNLEAVYMILGGFGLVAYYLASKKRKIIKWSKKIIQSLSLNGEILRAEYEGGSSQEYPIDRIRIRPENDFHPLGTIILRDGVKIKNAERFSYWPILLERIGGRYESNEYRRTSD